VPRVGRVSVGVDVVECGLNCAGDASLDSCAGSYQQSHQAIVHLTPPQQTRPAATFTSKIIIIIINIFNVA